ncbi:MAG TPA: lamin tail domain-containing protein [Kofleriaceae bacterium]|jgi:hypothetical protein|nr:lamin tail domain-containing protein [Kofleriaceae bacterium]
MRSLVITGAAAALVACGPGSNAGECDDTLLAGDLVITEVFADAKAPPGGSGTDEGKEWFEVYNATSRPVELKGLTITHSRPDGSRGKSHVMADITVAPGQYLTLGNSADDLLPAYVDYGYGADLGDMFNTDGGKLALACGAKEIDAATYESVKEGRSRQLTASQPPDYTLNDDPATWCEASAAEFEPGNFGTPGSESDCTPVTVGQCDEGGVMRDAVAPMPGDLVITEIMPKPSSASATVGQWFEVFVTRDIDLNGVIVDRANDSSAGKEIVSSDCVSVSAGSYVVFARSEDMTMNGGLTTVGTFPFSINPTNTPDLQLTYGGTLLDSVTWTTSTSGRSLSLDPDFLTTSGNDDAANFCDGESIYNGNDRGTPGAANPQCTLLPPAGMCQPETGAIREIVKPDAGQLVITEFLANPATTTTGVDAAQEWFEIQNTGSTAFDLNDLGLKGSATTVNVITSVNCKSIPPGGFGLFAHNNDPVLNAGLPEVDALFTFALGNSSGTLSVLDGTTPLDVVTWGTGWSVQDGASKQLLPAMTDVTSNDLPTSFCNGHPAQVYGTAANVGTPKEANSCP